MNEIPIHNTNGEFTVSSLQVAEDFGKQHKDVLKAIKNLLKETSAQNCANLTEEEISAQNLTAQNSALTNITAQNFALTKMFIESTYKAGTGKSYKYYEINRDGFALLAMGFTGKKALQWKLKYIEAFNLMEQQLKENAQIIDNSEIIKLAKQLQAFLDEFFNNSEFGEIRTIEENGKILFCGKDVAKALGYSKPANAIVAHCKEKGVTEIMTPTAGGIQKMKFITEGNVYRLITHSKLPSAERFEEWVFDEVLPTIRKTGSYTVPVEEESDDTDENPLINIVVKLMEVMQMEGISEKHKYILLEMAKEIITGKTLLQIESEKKQKTYLAGDIGRIFDVSAYQIGCIANVLDMKTSEYGEWYYYTRPTDGEEIRAFKYNEKALEKFRRIFETINE